MNIAIIPARGGSKRIPRKNIKDFLGEPIISLVIKKLISSKIFDKIIVSTDDNEIANISIASGVDRIIYRPYNLSNDHATTVPVISHAVSTLNSEGCFPDYVCCVYPCAPFVDLVDLANGFEIVKSSDVSYVYPVTEYSHPIQRALRIKRNGSLEFVNPEHELTRTQDLEKTFHDTGQFYWGKESCILMV
jgi:pseudaminic acid cytidylyltransferase